MNFCIIGGAKYIILILRGLFCKDTLKILTSLEWESFQTRAMPGRMSN